ncbi:hypothetical protein [Mameliella alba]|uniref:hypothetical protein n=2 Tax=Mameliella alba TaxID=561184 RepID=UPI000942083A|nr:hypothetical protein [Mameliella alba]OWV41856.1 hypothetical protein CDZ96_24250 [Mameliella alba]
MMLRLVLILGTLLALGGCMEGATAVGGSTGGGQGPEARKLSSGMTPAQAEGVFGLDAGYERNPANWDEACISYAYDGGARYVHAVYRNDRLVRATDGHGAICTYGAAL